MNQEPRFIEILGESSYLERPETYPVELEIKLTASLEDKQNIIEQFSELEIPALELLSKYNEKLHKLVDGGRRVTSYRDRRKTETAISRKFLLHFASMDTLDEFWGHVLEFNSSDSKLITFEPLQPFFAADSDHEQSAHDQAMKNARQRAIKLTDASNLKLGTMISAKQLALSERHSGAYSDEDWWGDAERFRPRYHIGGIASIDLEEPERVVYVRYLVRYEVQKN